MKKYYWFYVGSLLGLATVIFAYLMLNFLVVEGKLNIFSAIGIVVIYGLVTYLAEQVYKKIK